VRTGPGSYERQARLTEALLLLLVLLTLSLGGFLVLMAKMAVAPEVGKAVNINAATGGELARALGVPEDIGTALDATRKKRGGFTDVDALARVPLYEGDRAAAAEQLRALEAKTKKIPRAEVEKLLDIGPNRASRLLQLHINRPKWTWESLLRAPLVAPSRVSAASPRLVARTWEEARNTALGCGVALTLFLIVTHLLLRRFRPKADPFLLPVVGMLSVLGVLLLFGIKDPVRDIPSYAAQTQGIVIGGGIALLIALSAPLSRLPLHRYSYLYALAAIFGTMLLAVLGSGPGGVKLSVAGIQPVEAIKILMVYFLAAYLAERSGLLNDPARRRLFALPRPTDVLPLLLMYALPLALFSIVRDLGPVLLLFGTFLILVYLATGRGLYIWAGILGLGLAGWAGYALRIGVFETRVEMWLHPWNNVQKFGDHLVLGWWGLASGGPGGSGLGLGGPEFIPRGGSDLAFASLGEEVGIPGTVAVLVCFLALLARGLHIARRAGSEFERLLAAGLSALMVTQAFIIIAGTLGLLPLSGITLPFISHGKSSLVASYFIVGVLLALSNKAPAASLGIASHFAPATRRLNASFGLILGVVCLGWLVFLQGVAANRIAGRTVLVPDADNIRRPHLNPRLVELAERIPQGRILDRAGRALAETKNGKRVYPYGEATGHLIGYADPSIGGPVGLEAELQTRLRGFEDWTQMVTAWRMKDLPSYRLPEGQDVRLTLDAELQKAALAAFRQVTNGIRDRRGRPKNRGAVVVLDTATGGVLAAVTSPAYDPNMLTPKQLQEMNTDPDGQFPLINRALSGYYPPGSTFKIVTASALLLANQDGFTTNCVHVATNLKWSVDGIPYSRRRIVDDEGERPHSSTDLTEAVAESCNVYFARAGLQLGPDRLRETISLFGFAKIPAVTPFAAELPDIAFGQGPMLATPLEMAGVAQAVANGGTWLQPMLYETKEGGKRENILRTEDAERLGRMMGEVTISGTAARRFSSLGVSVAGKTGTAQNDRYDKRSHSWFIGFAPVERPQVAFAVIVENGGYGSQAAVPISRAVLGAISFNKE
jgi:cell division protein FtsW (lipid II flippase)